MELPNVHPGVFSHFSSMVIGDALGISDVSRTMIAVGVAVGVGVGVAVGAADAFVKFVRNVLLSSI
jgi:hypothetical protein